MMPSALIHILGFRFTYQVIQPSSPDRGTPIFDLPENKLWMEATMATYVILGAQLLLQVAFIFYSLTVLFPAKQKQPIPSYSH